MKLRILEKKYRIESVFYIQQQEGDTWCDLLNWGPYLALENARSACERISAPPPKPNHKEIIHDYP